MKSSNKKNKTILSFAYESDLEQVFAFYCARYKNISLDEFMELGITETQMKLNSIPESEPLFKIIKSRTIELSKIKNKEERKYWAELKRINKIPNMYLRDIEIYDNLKSQVKNINKVGGIK